MDKKTKNTELNERIFSMTENERETIRKNLIKLTGADLNIITAEENEIN